ncbi:hypothetical protein LS70_007070 [Helicobacter sp. MIT 11-5569]|uniref:SLAC1 family transporter n=1 Tax=Helicobacter sp. MIT 11-5569 TaxID=1548151 RepID=UPI00051FEA7B|nr:hypothetical protein [Helicobacter sp. MIT 11-5569]TLD82711.1 hypothetical protein LS70_007070 [Helicobacter sp. MIT 11-5569]
MSQAQQAQPPKINALSYLPVSFFGSCMGLSAISVAWHAMSHLSLLYSKDSQYNPAPMPQFSFIFHSFADMISLIFAAFAVGAFLALGIAYSLKLITNFESFKQEFLSPITRPFFATICIALLLLPFALDRLGIPEKISLFVWAIGAIFMLIFSVYIVQFWICQKFELAHITPAWIIPVVGLLDLPLALPLFSQFHAMPDIGFLISLFCLAVGFAFTIVLCTLIFARIVFFAKLPDKLMPTLVIFLAPFGAGVGAYMVLISMQALTLAEDSLGFLAIDSTPYILFLLGLFLFFTLLPQIIQIKKCCPFRISWWAISFPLAAMSIASIKINTEILEFSKACALLNSPFSHIEMVFWIVSISLLVFVTLIFIWLIGRTLVGILKGELQNLA